MLDKKPLYFGFIVDYLLSFNVSQSSLFFTSIGMRLDLSTLEAIPVFLLLLIAAAVLGKFLGTGVPVFWMTRNWKEALVVGNSMHPPSMAAL